MNILTWFLNWLLPNQVKRMIFLTSLAAYIRDIQSSDSETLQKLNDILSLAYNSDAMKLPIELHLKIWKNFDPSILQDAGIACDNIKTVNLVQLKKSQARILSNRIIDSVPSWLMYQSREVIRRDVYQLFARIDPILKVAA